MKRQDWIIIINTKFSLHHSLQPWVWLAAPPTNRILLVYYNHMLFGEEMDSSRSVQLTVALSAGVGIGVCIGMLLFRRRPRLNTDTPVVPPVQPEVS